MNPYRLLAIVALLPALLASPSPAQVADKLTARFSHTAGNSLRLGNSPAGEINVDAAFLEWRGSLAVTPATRVDYGLSWGLYDFDGSGPTAVPAELQEVSAVLGVSRRLNSQWLLMASLRPGLFGDLEDDAGEAFNAPALFLATWSQNRELAWSFGIRADAFADNPVLPILGVRWAFAPHWEFNLGFPRAGFSYEASPSLKLGLGATAQGGSFHVARDPRPAPIATPRLDDTYLDYREIRVGFSADYQLNSVFSVSLEAGMVTDQKFDYYDRDLMLNGDAAAFFTIGLSGRF